MKKIIKYTMFTLSILSNIALANVHTPKCDYMPTAKDTEIHFDSCQFNDDDVSRVMKNIPDHNLYVVDLSNNNLSAMSAKLIADKMTRAGSRSNAWVSIGNNHFGDEGAKILRNLSVTVVNISNNYLSSQGIDDIAHISGLKILNIGNNHLQPTDVSKLLKIKNLEYLFMQRATFDENNINEMARNKNIVGYSFADTNITPDQLYKITNNREFEILDLSGLNLTNDVFTSRKLYQSCDYLDLSNNPALDFGDDLIKRLNLDSSYKYSTLILANDNITNDDVSHILSSFAADGVGDIDLRGTHVTNQLSGMIDKAKAVVRYLVIDNANINVDGLQQLLNNNYVERVELENKLLYLDHQSTHAMKNDISSSHKYDMYYSRSMLHHN